MSHGSDPISRARFPEATKEEPQAEQLTAGVPLTKLIKRELVDAPDIVMLGKSRSLAAEKFQRLKTTLANDEGGGPQVIVVTSTGPSEGKSVVSMNLALAFAADSEDRVLLIDADLRRPTVEHWVSPSPKLGLSEVLAGRTEMEHTLLNLSNTALNILPAGTPPRDPVVLLSSAKFQQLLLDLRGKYKRIIIDTPPIVPFTDADAVGAMSDGVLLVARSGRTRRSLFKQAVDSVTSTRLLGIVLNDATYNLADRENYSAYDKNYYNYYNKDRRK